MPNILVWNVIRSKSFKFCFINVRETTREEITTNKCENGLNFQLLQYLERLLLSEFI